MAERYPAVEPYESGLLEVGDGHTSVAPSAFARFRFPPEVITLAVRWYLRFGLSYRDVEELLAERGVDVDHVTVFRWYSGSRHCSSTRPALPARPGDRWFPTPTNAEVRRD